MIAGMTKRSHSREGGNPVLANVIPLDSRQMIAGMDEWRDVIRLPILNLVNPV
jgi:hypothetical protein